MTADRQPSDRFGTSRPTQSGTVFEGSMVEEAEPGNRAQDTRQLGEKLRAESARDGGGVLGWLRALVHHADRDLAGEYERREDPEAPINPDAPMSEQQPPAGSGR